LKTIAGDLLLQRWAGEGGSAEPLNRRLYECLRRAILDGSLPAGARLPATRELAALLAVSRNTVKYAYEQLLAEGYLRAATGSGTFVADALPEQVLWAAPRAGAGEPAGAPAAVPLSQRGRRAVAGALAQSQQWGAFMPGVPDVTEFPRRKFEAIASRWRRAPPPEWLTYGSGGGLPALRQALAHYLRQSRSVVCDADQVLITEGVHQAVDLAARLLADAGDRAWLEEPGYWGVRSILAMNGLATQGVPVDAEGLDLAAAPAGPPPRLIFVTPSHQYPLGSIMSLRRRLQLLDYARQHGCWVVEDDYDSEFRFSGHAIPSLQGLTGDAPVVYIGTFSKTLYPGLRVAYMVVPRPLAPAFRTAHAELYREGHLLTQAALAAFIDEGHYAAHIRRMRLVYSQRRAALVALVEERLGAGWIHPHDSNAGLHLVLSLPPALDDVEVARLARARGVLGQPLSRYYGAGRPASGLLLGFACVKPQDMAAPFDALVQCLGRHAAGMDRRLLARRRAEPA